MARPYPDIPVFRKDSAVLLDQRFTAGDAEGQLTFGASGGDPRGRALGDCDKRVWLRARLDGR